MIACRLLEGLDASDLGEAFKGGRLEPYAAGDARWDAPGILESLAVQLPERFGVELHDYIPYAEREFLSSLVWRRSEAFTAKTWDAIRLLLKNPERREGVYEVALTVAGAPQHPLNAAFLDDYLHNMTMVERDATWTTYINETDDNDAPALLVRWALLTQIGDAYDSEALTLVGTALAWLLSSSHRRLRDTATKALSQLCTQTLATATTLLKHFADVNDPYVLERVSAAAYGAATRSANVRQAAGLAGAVYAHFFSDPARVPLHLLTRDYLRGIVELAHARGAAFSMEQVRPPYGAAFPEPPPIEALERLADYDGPSDNPGLRAAWYSVQHGDFALYIIGTNSGASAWLSTRLHESLPPTPEDIIKEFEAQLDQNQGRAFRLFRVVDRLNVFGLEPLASSMTSDCPRDDADAQNLDISATDAGTSGADGLATPTADAEDEQLIDDLTKAILGNILGHIPAEFEGEPLPPHAAALASLRDLLHPELLSEFNRNVLPALGARYVRDRFDLGLVQRSVMDYVLRTGYSAALSNYDEALNRRDFRREPRLRERIGKKYQWQGLYSCLARIADNFVFTGSSSNTTPITYDGPWQTGRRNIDPTYVTPMAENRQQRSSDEHWKSVAPAISSGMLYDASSLAEAFRALFLRAEGDGTWVLLDGDYVWREEPPLGRSEYSVRRREVWTDIGAYIVHYRDVDHWFDWAVKQNWWNHWMPETPSFHEIYRGEFYWASSYKSAIEASDAAGWTREAQFRDLPIEILVGTVAYYAEGGSSDASIDGSIEFSLPCDTLVRDLDVTWNGNPWAVQDAAGREVFSCRETGEERQMALWGHLDIVLEILKRHEITLAWTILAEARTLLPSAEHGTGRYDGSIFAGTAVLMADGTLRLAVNPVDPHPGR